MRALLLSAAGLVLASAASGGTLTLSPAAVPLKGRFGQSASQALTLFNGTDVPLEFALEAKDVVIRDGRRAFVTAGELPGSIAASAVFSDRQVVVAPGQSRRVEVRLTLPASARHRAVVCLFRGLTRIGRAVPSLGTLLTFTLSDDLALSPAPLAVEPQTAASNLALLEPLSNDGQEPLVPKGVAVILDARGMLVGRAAFESRRLLPGEQATVRAEYPGELTPGTYRAIAAFDYEGRTVTREASFQVP